MPWNIMRRVTLDDEEIGRDYWSNEQGWGNGQEEATSFTDEEKERFVHLPLDGEWVPAREQIADRTLQDAYNDLAASADDAGCTDDLIVVSHRALLALGDVIFGQKEQPCT